MKKVTLRVARPIKVLLNSTNTDKNQWATIRCATTGATLHTGRPDYIKRIAKVKYNHTS